MSNKAFKLVADKMGGRAASAYIGREGEVFYDPEVPAFRVSDGVTPGGTALSTGGSSDALTSGAETLTLANAALTYSNTIMEIVTQSNSAVAFSDGIVTVRAATPGDGDEILPTTATWQFKAGEANAGLVVCPPETSFNSSLGTISIGTTDQSLSSLRGAFAEFYDTTANNAWFNLTARGPDGHTASVYGGSDPDDDLYVSIDTYDGGAVYGGMSWRFFQSGITQFPVAPAPATSVGQTGDVAGLVALTQSYFYFCVAPYDGSSDIWKRIAWPSETW